ncbi:hypothetical protein F4861DRAFT_536377 [Xylaria intraflava]|nr:hypothetical protein F4861DRAFT_536377 [Xylaria intraflava]
MDANRRAELVRTNVLNSVNGSVKIDDRWPRSSFLTGPPKLPDRFHNSQLVGECLDALYTLQATRTYYLSPSAMAVPLQFLHNSLPYMVQKDVNIIQPDNDDFWRHENWHEYLQNAERLREVREKYHTQLTTRRYQFWPIDLHRRNPDNHNPNDYKGARWGLIVLHMRNAPDPDNHDEDHDELDAPYNAVHSFAVINPDHGQQARNLEDDITLELLHMLPEIGIGVEGAVQIHPWDTMNAPQLTEDGQEEYWSAGLRVFEIVRVMLDRIAAVYCRNPYSFDEVSFYKGHSGWFNPDAVRAVMIGMAAAMVNRAMNGTTRVAIEPILDKQIKGSRWPNEGEEFSTVTMMPDRTHVGAFDSEQRIRSPTWLSDAPDGTPQAIWRDNRRAGGP